MMALLFGMVGLFVMTTPFAAACRGVHCLLYRQAKAEQEEAEDLPILDSSCGTSATNQFERVFVID